MELDWRNRCVGGERLEDLCNVVGRLDAAHEDELFDLLWEHADVALPFHRAMLRVSAELLWERAAQLRLSTLRWSDQVSDLTEEAYHEVLLRAGLELGRDRGLT
jgi:hypothetical protein